MNELEQRDLMRLSRDRFDYWAGELLGAKLNRCSPTENDERVLLQESPGRREQ